MNKSIYGNNSDDCSSIDDKQIKRVFYIFNDILDQLNNNKNKKTALDRLNGLLDLISVIDENK